jgi:hypothetical protein
MEFLSRFFSFVLFASCCIDDLESFESFKTWCWKLFNFQDYVMSRSNKNNKNKSLSSLTPASTAEQATPVF